MPTTTRCEKCGGVAVLSYIKIPRSDTDADGTAQYPSEWMYIVECAQCGRREQRGDSSPRAATKIAPTESGRLGPPLS